MEGNSMAYGYGEGGEGHSYDGRPSAAMCIDGGQDLNDR